MIVPKIRVLDSFGVGIGVTLKEEQWLKTSSRNHVPHGVTSVVSFLFHRE